MPRPTRKQIALGAGLFLAGALLGALGARWLLPGPTADGRAGASASTPEQIQRVNRRLEQRFQTAMSELRSRQEMNRRRFRHLQSFIRFADVGQQTVPLVLVSPDGSARLGTLLDRGRTVAIPRVVVDPSARREWTRLRDRLSGLAGRVDERVESAFREVVRFQRNHPWPEEETVRAAVESEWAGTATVSRWRTLHQRLRSRAESLLSMGR